MSYDQALAQAERIVKELESAEALPMEVYKAKAAEARGYLEVCRKELGQLLVGEMDEHMPVGGENL